MPAPHVAHGVEPPGEYCPAVQPTHADCPTALVKRPAGHAVHDGEAVAFANVPAAHALHVADPPPL